MEIYYARNQAIEKSTGEYVCFIAADNAFCDKTMLSRLFRQASNDKYDLISSKGLCLDMKRFEIFIRKIANYFGIDITRYRDGSTDSAKLVKILNQNRIDLVIDIGANRGQYGKLLRRYGYQGRIISFEPLQDAWDDLQKISPKDGKWEIFPRCAIGASNSSAIINVSANSVSSSILGMLDQHAKAAPDSVYIREEMVQVITLDEALSKVHISGENMLIKIDTQGYEKQVLDGAQFSISKAIGIQIELSLVPLYSGQTLFQETIERLIRDGFSIWSIFPGFTDKSSGRMLQCDAVLFKKKAENFHATT